MMEVKQNQQTVQDTLSANTQKSPEVQETTVKAPTVIQTGQPINVIQEILNALRNWVSCWVSRNSYRYLSNYSKEYKPQENLTLKQ